MWGWINEGTIPKNVSLSQIFTPFCKHSRTFLKTYLFDRFFISCLMHSAIPLVCSGNKKYDELLHKLFLYSFLRGNYILSKIFPPRNGTSDVEHRTLYYSKLQQYLSL